MASPAVGLEPADAIAAVARSPARWREEVVRLFMVFAVVASAARTALGEDVTLPAAASIIGAAPFFSDVRAFNTSYTDSLDVTMQYRCFIGCGAAASPVTFALAPRQSRAFNDIVVSQFNSPNTAGGIEFEFSGADEQLVVTSRLYSTEPEPTVGMFIPALPNSEAYPTTVLSSIQNGGANLGFRTNVGVFNREDSATDVTFRIFHNGAQVGSSLTRSVPGHSGVQVNNVFNAAGQGALVTNNAVIVVSASHEIFSYAAVIDNNTTDPIFVVGAEDQPSQPITPVLTHSPTPPGGPTATRTSTRTPTVTPTAPAGSHTVNVGQDGSNFVDVVSGTNTTTITVGTEVNWVWVNGFHSTTASTPPETWDSGNHPPPFSFQHTFNQTGTFQYICAVHGPAMSGTVIVHP
jgi:plastocyanin